MEIEEMPFTIESRQIWNDTGITLVAGQNIIFKQQVNGQTGKTPAMPTAIKVPTFS